MQKKWGVEWPTLALIVACYLFWLFALTWCAVLWVPLGIAVATLCLTLHSSLTHEAIHGHPTPNRVVNQALLWPALGLLVPYQRFRDTHLSHHMDARLTDPYDDPESNYFDPDVWARLPKWVQALLRANNTLLGRITLGPAIGQIAFLTEDWKAIRRGDASVRRAWLLHLPAVTIVLAIVVVSPMPLWAYLVAVYLSHGLVRIRTFLEHQAHEHTAGRTVIIEDRGPLSFLFLNNNLHFVHHMHPSVSWYRLPQLYAANCNRYLRRNHGYRYSSYGEIFRQHFLNAKDPVPHPLWTKGNTVRGAGRPETASHPATGPTCLDDRVMDRSGAARS